MMTPAGRARLDALRQEAVGSICNLPWGGRSPRVLTRAYEKFTLRREDAEMSAEERHVEEQYRRFLQS